MSQRYYRKGVLTPSALPLEVDKPCSGTFINRRNNAMNGNNVRNQGIVEIPNLSAQISDVQAQAIKRFHDETRKTWYCPKSGLLFKPDDVEWHRGTAMCPVHGIRLRER